MSTVVNPSAGNRYFTNAGAAIGSTTQPDVDGGAIAAAYGEQNSRFNSMNMGQDPSPKNRITKTFNTVDDNLHPIVFTSEGTASSASAPTLDSENRVVLHIENHSLDLDVNGYFYLNGWDGDNADLINDKIHQIYSIGGSPGTEDITLRTQAPGLNTSEGDDPQYMSSLEVFGTTQKVSLIDLSPASGPNRDVNSRASIRTTKTATAIRAGYWDETAGEFSTAPSTANDFSTVGADNVLTENKLAYNAGGTPVQASY